MIIGSNFVGKRCIIWVFSMVKWVFSMVSSSLMLRLMLRHTWIFSMIIWVFSMVSRRLSQVFSMVSSSVLTRTFWVFSIKGLDLLNTIVLLIKLIWVQWIISSTLWWRIQIPEWSCLWRDLIIYLWHARYSSGCLSSQWAGLNWLKKAMCVS